MIRVALATVTLVAVAPAGAQNLDNVAAIATMQGKCVRLVTPDGDLTVRCGRQIINTTYRDNHSSFMIPIDKDIVMSFWGEDHAAIDDRAVMTVRKITTAQTGHGKPMPQDADGQCSYTNPYAGPSHIDCTATVAGKTYAFSFVSDGQAPNVMRL
jgi:hypothetical protein